jgi:lysylphosphatidylglycerol synthetase-like protein (DUF2156 family)
MKEDVRCNALAFARLYGLQAGRVYSLALMRFSPTSREERFTC